LGSFVDEFDADQGAKVVRGYGFGELDDIIRPASELLKDGGSVAEY
jgi:hypothetical protein